MSLSWFLGSNLSFDDIIDKGYQLENENDNLPFYLPCFLLDVKLYKQLQSLDEKTNYTSSYNNDNENKTVFNYLRYYSRINELIIQNRIDLISIDNYKDPIENDSARSYMYTFFERINNWLNDRSASRKNYPVFDLNLPESLKSNLKDKINKIIRLVNPDIEIDDEPHSIKD